MNSENIGLIFNIQRFSIHDGPGIRTTVFFKGCPLVCEWCSNPESQKLPPEIITVDRKCIGCGKCVESCASKAITLDESGRTIDWSRCIQCMECAATCPSGAIEAVGRYVTVDELIAEVKKDSLFYQNSGGGVTLSGGEPLSQWKFALNFSKQCRRENLHTALDTSGYARWEVIDRVTEFVDLVLFDIKHMDLAKHKALMGVDNRLIFDNVVKVSRKVKTWIRYPVIPGCNASASEIESVAAFVAKLPVEKVSLLSYHKMGIQKYERLGRQYSLSQLLPPTKEFMESVRKVFESFGLRVSIDE